MWGINFGSLCSHSIRDICQGEASTWSSCRSSPSHRRYIQTFLQLLGALETDSRCWSPEVTGMRIRRMKKHFCKRLLDLDILNILILQSTDNADCRFGLLQGCKAQVWLWIGVFSNELMFLSGRPIHQKATYHVYRFTHACPSLFVYRISRMVSGGTSSWQSFNTLGIIHADWTGDISWLKTAHLEQCFCLMQSNESC